MLFRLSWIRRLLFGAGCLWLASWAGQAALAQQPQDRRQFFDGLVRGLVDSQLQTPSAPLQESGPRRAPADEIAQARPLIDSIANDASRLTDAVYAEVARLPQLRSYLNDVLQLRAQAIVLSDQARRAVDVDRLRADVRLLDGDWRVLHGQLTQIDGLAAGTRQIVDRIQANDDRLLQLLNVRPQLDANAIIRVLAGLGASLDHLTEDIELEVPPSNSRIQLLRDARLTRDQVNYVSRAVEKRIEATTVVQEYRRFRDSWYSLAARLRPLQNRYIDRHIRRIEKIDRDARELLWISDTIDQAQILSLALNLNQDVDRLFDQLTINDLLRKGAESRALLASADDLQRDCNLLIRSFDGDTPRSELSQLVNRIQGSWVKLDTAVVNSANNDARNLMGEIRETIGVIGGAIGMRSNNDRRRLAQVAASVENLADHLLFEASDYVRNASRTGARPPLDLLDSATRFRDQARLFNRAVASSTDVVYLRQHNERLTQSWNQLTTSMAQVAARDRQQMANIGASITPGLTELQTMLSL